MKMSILVPNINQCGQKGLSFEVRHKAYARPLCIMPQPITNIITMKKIVLQFCILLLSCITYGQTPEILHSSAFGGSVDEYAYDIAIGTEGGYIIAGYTNSNDGDVIGQHGSDDYWVVKVDVDGSIEWQKCLGGSLSDQAFSIENTVDGGYVIAGRSSSTDGDVHGNQGQMDSWIVKINEVGIIEWERCYGGASLDGAYDINVTDDGGYIVAGTTMSIDSITGYPEGWDLWVFKINALVGLEWQNSYGGSNNDAARSIEQTSDGGFIVAGYSDSNDGDLETNYGDIDYWVVKLSADGLLENQRNYGGSGYDMATSIHQTEDGGYILAGFSNSSDGEVSNAFGLFDYWIVKLNETLDIQWQKSFGGSSDDLPGSIQITNKGGFLVAGESHSNDGNVSGNKGQSDYWILALNETGSIEWQKCFGGTGNDYAMQVKELTNNEIVVIGSSSSDDIDIPVNNGLSDFWFVKLNGPDAIMDNDNEELSFYPNPAEKEIMISNGNTSIVEIVIYNQLGELVLQKEILTDKVDISELVQGVYIIDLISKGSNIRKKLIVK